MWPLAPAANRAFGDADRERRRPGGHAREREPRQFLQADDELFVRALCREP
jgi:hypothetical protein